MSANDSASHPSPSRLSYTIAGCSEHSNRYVAENIMVDAPKDPNSRWSGQHESPSMKQWILLRLDELSVVGKSPTHCAELLLKSAQDSITFGKVRPLTRLKAPLANRLPAFRLFPSTTNVGRYCLHRHDKA